MINIKDKYTYGHTERVVIYAKYFGNYINLSHEDNIILQVSAYLHDIGKLEIPEEVLNKIDKLTDEELVMFRNHPQAGVDLIQNIKQFDQNEKFTPYLFKNELFEGKFLLDDKCKVLEYKIRKI